MNRSFKYITFSSTPTIPVIEGIKPHRPAPPIPPKKPIESNDTQQTTENIYLAAMGISSLLINEEEDDLSKIPTKKIDEVPFEDKVSIK